MIPDTNEGANNEMIHENLKTVAMIGLGNMGAALAESLLDAGFHISAWNRSQSKLQKFIHPNFTACANVADAASQSDVMVICLLDHNATNDAVMFDEIGKAMTGKPLIQLSTTTKDQVDDLCAWVSNHQIPLLKGGIMVYPDDIRTGRGAILYGGPKPLFDQLHPVLNAMGGQPTHVCEKPADVVASISASYAFLYSSLMSYLYGAAICHRGGVSVEAFTQNVIEPFISGGSLFRYLQNAGQAAASRKYDGELQATLDVWDDALLQVMTDIKAIEIATTILQPLKSLLEETSAQGHGEQDIAAVVETLLHRH